MVKTYIEQLIPISFKTTVFSPTGNALIRKKKKKATNSLLAKGRER